jgi:hypothetical protein
MLNIMTRKADPAMLFQERQQKGLSRRQGYGRQAPFHLLFLPT